MLRSIDRVALLHQEALNAEIWDDWLELPPAEPSWLAWRDGPSPPLLWATGEAVGSLVGVLRVAPFLWKAEVKPVSRAALA